MIVWRSLLDIINIPWKDRGANCSFGHLVIKCPWCGRNDPSAHLRINEETGQYFCLRTPGKQHSGKSPHWLLLGLGIPHDEIDGLIAEHSDRRQPKLLVAASTTIMPWNRFEPAADHDAAIEYLASRGYADPRNITLRFGLRFTRVGHHSWRVLMPLTCPGDNGQVLAFTGRAIRPNQSPRYLTNDPMGGSLYVPLANSSVAIVALQGTSLRDEKKLHLGQLASAHPCLLICEGPFDALTLALVAHRVALPAGAYYIPDADQWAADTYRLIDELCGIPGMSHVRRLPLPSGAGDLGEMANNAEGVVRWLTQHLSRNGMAQ